MDELKELLQGEFPEIDFDKEKQLVTDGILDSVSVVQIISMIEDHYDIDVTMEYIQPKYFESLEAMLDMIDELE